MKNMNFRCESSFVAVRQMRESNRLTSICVIDNVKLMSI